MPQPGSGGIPLTGDGVSGFNQIDNSLFAQKVLAVVSLSGKHLPRSLGFGPTNGPDFPRFGLTRLRKLFRTWFLFIDDVLVATGTGDFPSKVSEDEVSRALKAVSDRGQSAELEPRIEAPALDEVRRQ